MKSQILVKKYTQGLVNSIKDEAEFLAISRELSDFADVIKKHKKLKDMLSSPFLPIAKKKQIIEEILVRKSLEKKAEKFISLLVENNRFEIFSDILESLPEAWNEKKGICTLEVATVVPLSNNQRKELEKRLELLEGRPVSLKTKIDPELIGGLWVRKGNVVYDLSIKGSLMRLKEKICEG